MRRGLPVVSSDLSSLPEVGGDAVLYFNPYRIEEMADAVTKVLTDRDFAAELSSKGTDRQQIFTWRRTAEVTFVSYERARSAR
jgi:glycosyltransferase involved in cell wall biosynthesis